MYCVSSISLCLREGGVKRLEDGRTVIKNTPSNENDIILKSYVSTEKLRSKDAKYSENKRFTPYRIKS